MKQSQVCLTEKSEADNASDKSLVPSATKVNPAHIWLTNISRLLSVFMLGAGQVTLLICLPVLVSETAIGYDIFAGLIALGTFLLGESLILTGTFMLFSSAVETGLHCLI